MLKKVLFAIGYCLWTAMVIGVYFIAIVGRVNDLKDFADEWSEDL